MYFDRDSLELTLELNPVMKPPAAEVAGSMWEHNLPALLRFIELVRSRLRTAQHLKPQTSCTCSTRQSCPGRQYALLLWCSAAQHHW